MWMLASAFPTAAFSTRGAWGAGTSAASATIRRSLVSCSALLPSTPLPYRGVRLDLTAADAPGFAEKIGPSLDHWRGEGRQSAMLRLPIELAGLASVAAEHGFEFHHAEGRHCVLKCWLPTDREDKVPPYATHQVGVAGFVLNAQGQLLVVKEWRDTPSGREGSPNWKLPGGLLDRGESFEEGAAREVSVRSAPDAGVAPRHGIATRDAAHDTSSCARPSWQVIEETGVASRFHSILAFWHRHGLTWGKSDLYYVARMEPTSSEEIVMQADEISDCRWMDLDEFVQTQDHPLILAVCRKVYGLTKREYGADAERSATAAPVPLAEMVMEGVAWPGRAPYPTYFSTGRSE